MGALGNVLKAVRSVRVGKGHSWVHLDTCRIRSRTRNCLSEECERYGRGGWGGQRGKGTNRYPLVALYSPTPSKNLQRQVPRIRRVQPKCVSPAAQLQKRPPAAQTLPALLPSLPLHSECPPLLPGSHPADAMQPAELLPPVLCTQRTVRSDGQGWRNRSEYAAKLAREGVDGEGKDDLFESEFELIEMVTSNSLITYFDVMIFTMSRIKSIRILLRNNLCW